ncbi:MAG: MFS transporter [Mariniblastus sp.]|nr:MFS transporter [Mariniblastus sp.]
MSHPTRNGRLIGLSLIARLITDTGSQIFNPFLPFIAKGLSVDAISLGGMVSLRSAMGILAPFFGTIGDRHGFRNVLIFSLGCCSLGCLLVGLASHWWLACVGMAIWGVGAAGFVPTLHAYLGASLAYDVRARGIGIVEYGWALAGIVGLSSSAWLITVWNWRAPFFLLSGLMLLMAGVFLRLPKTKQAESDDLTAKTHRSSFKSFFQLGNNACSAYAVMIGGSLSFFAAMQIYIAHGFWLDTEYHIGPAKLGIIAFILGLSDLAGSVSVSLFTDRIGKRRSVLIGIYSALIAYLLLPYLNQGLILSVIGLALARTSFEFAIVSNITLLSEQVPEQRGKVMTLGAAFGLVGLTLAGTSGPWLYSAFGIGGLSLTSATFTAMAIFIYHRYTRERSGK